jgi:hypothetical protein
MELNKGLFNMKNVLHTSLIFTLLSMPVAFATEGNLNISVKTQSSTSAVYSKWQDTFRLSETEFASAVNRYFDYYENRLTTSEASYHFDTAAKIVIERKKAGLPISTEQKKKLIASKNTLDAEIATYAGVPVRRLNDFNTAANEYLREKKR